MNKFDDIKPYEDAEVRKIVNNLIEDSQFIQMITHYKTPLLHRFFPQITCYIMRIVIKRYLSSVDSIHSFQAALKPLVDKMIQQTTTGVTFSGIENISSNKSYLFLSNHRDIVLDPAFINYGLYQAGLQTPRIAIGDNLLTYPFVSDLMRLNKSFIVKRSTENRREKLKALQQLSAYIFYSITNGHSIWIAQSEGRAKDGDDRTETALIKMLYMGRNNKTISFTQYMQSLHIIPVAVSYEYDPCAAHKAIELYQKQKTGVYIKATNEDMLSIAESVKGFKGKVHVAFGHEITETSNDPAVLSSTVDDQIHHLYHLYLSNIFAVQMLHPTCFSDKIALYLSHFSDRQLQEYKTKFCQYVNAIPKHLHHILLDMYARPVINKYHLKC